MNISLKFTLILLLFVDISVDCSARLHGQPLIDSMLTALGKAKDDTNKVKLLSDLSNTYTNFSIDTGIMYGLKCLTLAEKLKWKYGLAAAYINLGVNYREKGDYIKAVEFCLKSLDIHEQLNNKKGLAIANYSVGNIYCLKGEYPLALGHYFKALKLFEDLDKKNGISAVTGAIGSVYHAEKNDVRALEYFMKAKAIDEQLHDDIGVAINLEKIGHIYRAMNDLNKALKYYNDAAKLNGEIGDSISYGRVILSIGSVSSDLGDYTFTLKKSEEALKIFEALGSISNAATALENIGISYVNLGTDTINVGKGETVRINKPLLSRGIEYLLKANKIYTELDETDKMRSNYSILEHTYMLIGNYKNAYENNKLAVALNDSVFSLEAKKAITNLETKREHELKDKQIVIDKLEVAKKRNTNIFLSVGIVVLLGVIIVVVKERKKSDKLLLNILPVDVAKELKNKGSADARLFDDVTVLFTDFVSFTKVSERLTPQQLVGELHDCFMAFDMIMGKYGIEKIKTVGDAYLAVSGLPASNIRHAENIVNAAIEICQFMKHRKQLLGDKTFEIRVGVNSGNVVAGIVGVKKFAYDIWGDTVNTAARMEQNSEAGRINISQTTYELIKDKYRCEYRGEILAKNKGQLKMYFIS